MSKLVIALFLSALSMSASASTTTTLGSCDFSSGYWGGYSGGFDTAVCSFQSTTTSQLTVSNMGGALIDPQYHGPYGIAIDLWNGSAWTNVFTSATYNNNTLLSSILTGPIDFAAMTTDKLRLRSDIDHGYNFHDGADNLTFTLNDAAAVPEPATLALLGLGIAGLGMSRRRKLAD